MRVTQVQSKQNQLPSPAGCRENKQGGPPKLCDGRHVRADNEEEGHWGAGRRAQERREYSNSGRYRSPRLKFK